MDLKDKESLISKQERAARQQELLERKRRAKAEYNTSPVRPEKKLSERKPVKRKKREKESNKRIFARRIHADAVKKATQDPERPVEGTVSTSQWFLSVCWLKIPVIGMIYAVFLALGRSVPDEKRNFARGYLLYRVLVLLLSLAVLYFIYHIGLGLVEELLTYVKG